MYKPKTRSVRLLLEELADELLIYDVEQNKVHCLNGIAMRVWSLCDGERTVSEIARAVGTDLESDEVEALVWSALDQFAEKHLLEDVKVGEPIEEQPLEAYKPEGMSRRQMLLKVSMAVALLPLVDSIVSPEAALAQSMGTSGASPGPFEGITGPSGP
jgi:hypothetical protein